MRVVLQLRKCRLTALHEKVDPQQLKHLGPDDRYDPARTTMTFRTSDRAAPCF